MNMYSIVQGSKNHINGILGCGVISCQYGIHCTAHSVDPVADNKLLTKLMSKGVVFSFLFFTDCKLCIATCDR